MKNMDRRASYARNRMLGAQLRAVRLGHTRLTLEQAAELARMSLSSLSRTENGRRRITSEEVAGLLALYGVSAQLREAILTLARIDERAGWWQPKLEGDLAAADALASYERDAHVITEWVITVAPKLLQTEAYALARMRAEGISGDDAAAHWEGLRQKQQLLQRVDYTVFIHEFALRTPFGGAAGFKEQLLRLIDASHRGVGVRLVRTGAPLRALAHSWLMLEFPRDPALVYLELQGSSVFLHEPASVVYADVREELRRNACSVAATRTALTRFVNRF
ncbi:helix-turn-helix domain-containing protein [Actinokineospora sp. NPDC004072]